jgi:hypothetical protein
MKSRETGIIGNELRTIDFLTDLKIPEGMDRSLKKKIVAFNGNAHRLRIKIPEGKLSTLQPDLIIAVHEFIVDNESLLNEIQNSLWHEEPKIDDWNGRVAQVGLLLNDATNFQQWAKEVIPDWFEKRKTLIPLPTQLFSPEKPDNFSQHYFAYIETI